jgi:hypothetical protein
VFCVAGQFQKKPSKAIRDLVVGALDGQRHVDKGSNPTTSLA